MKGIVLTNGRFYFKVNDNEVEAFADTKEEAIQMIKGSMGRDARIVFLKQVKSSGYLPKKISLQYSIGGL
jgi:hypothetical protein